MDLLQIKNITAGYGEKIIIDNVSFSMKAGQLTALLGLNGTGKTTLLKTISGLIKPISGQCLVNGKDSFKLKEKERAKHISYMPQRHSIIYDSSVIDVVLMGITPYLNLFETPSNNHRDLAYEMLSLIEMNHVAHKSFIKLSEGQKQLILIARCLLQSSEIMLFDEPDSALDFKNRHMVLKKIKDIITENNRGGLITLHDPNFALNYCDNIILIKDGKIFAEFSTHDINKKYLHNIFSSIYGDVEIIEYKNKYVIVRLDI